MPHTHVWFRSQPDAAEITRRLDEHSSWIELDLDSLSFNLARIRERVGPEVEVMPVVKNDAYGHGLVPITAHLVGEGVRWVMVAKLLEAERLGAAGIECEVLVMDVLFTGAQCDRVVEQGLTMAVFTEEAALQLDAAGRRRGRVAQVFVKVDTGLRRVGVRHDLAPDLIERIAAMPNVRVAGVFSSFMQHPDRDREMLERFKAVCGEVERRGVEIPFRSIASTNAILHDPEAWLDMVRPAMCLYGVHPFDRDAESGLELRPVLSMKARIEYVKEVAKGDSVTYFGTFTAPAPMRVGTLHIGFRDAIPRELANKARYGVGGRIMPGVGTIALNHALLDLTGTDAAAGDVVEVFAHEGENSLLAMARAAGWMVYSLMNHLSPDLPRVCRRGGVPVALREPDADKG
ncbi:MAG: alanine racemase [Chromatiales bacterium]|nr:alanine racemase [Chromatiales bacterium]